MKILFVNSQDIFYTPTFVRTLLHALGLKEIGHEVSIVSFIEPRRNYDKPILQSEDIQIPYYEFSPFSIFKNIFIFLKLIQKYDLIWIEKSAPYMVLPLIIANLFYEKPLHYDWTDSDADFAKRTYKYSVWPWLVNLYENNFPTLSKTISSASIYLKNRSEKYKKPILFLPASVNCNFKIRSENSRSILRKKLNLDAKTTAFMFLGGLEAGTYVNHIIMAFEKAYEQNKNIHLIIVGGGTYLEDLKLMVHAINLNHCITFTGLILNSEVNEWASACDVALAPMQENNYTIAKSPVKIVEYLSFSLPIIAANVGDCKNLIGDAGIIINDYSVDSLNEAILSISSKKELINELSIIARKRAEDNFHYLKTAHKIEMFLKNQYIDLF